MVPMPMKPVQHLFTEYADYDVDEHGGFRLGRRNENWVYPFKEVADSYERNQTAKSLNIHLHKADAISVYSSGPRTRRSDSPGPIYTAIGTWTSTLTAQQMVPRDARLAMVGQEMYPDSIGSDDLADD